MMKEWQIRHLEEHEKEFVLNVSGDTSVREYAADYGHIENLYERVCSDLGITPRTQPLREWLALVSATSPDTGEFTMTTRDDDGTPVTATKQFDGTWRIEKRA